MKGLIFLLPPWQSSDLFVNLYIYQSLIFMARWVCRFTPSDLRVPLSLPVFSFPSNLPIIILPLRSSGGLSSETEKENMTYLAAATVLVWL